MKLLTVLSSLALLLTVFWGVNSFATTGIQKPKIAKKKPLITDTYDQNNGIFTKVLQQAVVMHGAFSKVRYRWLQNHQDKYFLLYLRNLQFVAPATYNSWTKNEKEAFLINAYNALILKMIVDNYPVKSIKKMGSMFAHPFNMQYIALLWRNLSLDNIQNMLLKFHDPRIFFALNRASIGSPELLNKAYVASHLNKQLNEQARLFLRDGVRNKIDVANKTLKLSKIFDWYKTDFTKKAGSVERFIAPYITNNPAVRKELMNNKFKISYTTYDWKLNEAK